MPELILPRPSEKQILFMTDKHKFLGYGGSRGGGKSFGVQLDSITASMKYHGCKSMIIRKTYPELQENHIQPMCEMLHVYDQDKSRRCASYNDQKKVLTFPNGSRILFRYCDTDKDAERFQGTQCDRLYVDEAAQHPEERIKKLTACVRGANNFPKVIRYTFNPGGEGHAWVKKLFIDRDFSGGENPEDYAFIQSSVYDNKALMKLNPDYVSQLEALPPHLRDMWLYGNWDLYEGQFFEDLRLVPDLQAAHDHGCDDDKETLLKDKKWVHVIEPFQIPRGWNIFRSYDFGYGKPFSCAWWAVDYDGVMYRILELYGCTETPNEGLKWSPDRQFEEIARIESEHPWLKGKKITGVADPAIWDGSRGESIADTGIRYGIYFQKGENARVAGWMQVHYRLQFDENGYSRMYIFNNCKAFIRTMPLLIYDEHKPEDLDTDLEDHVADEVRYACMSRPVKPLRPVKTRTIFFDPLNQFTQK